MHFLTYWFEEGADTGFCLIEGPDQQSIEAAHREAHGLMPSQVIEVDEALVRGFFGRLNTHPAGEPYVDSAFRAIVFTDIVDSTRLTQQLGDRGALSLLRSTTPSCDRRSTAWRQGDKDTGDGIMAAFDSAFRAVEAAAQISDARGPSAEAPDLRVRIGVASGEPVAEQDDLFGGGCAAGCAAVWSAAGLLSSSSAVHDLCRGKGIGSRTSGGA